MNKAKKKKQVAADPLQEAPNPMCPCEPAAPPVETFDERVVKATRSMSPEKLRAHEAEEISSEDEDEVAQ